MTPMYQMLCLLSLLFALASSAWAGGVRCTTYEERTMGRLQTLCDDGTRATSSWNRTLERWETTVTPAPGQADRWRDHPKAWPWARRGR
jgi:hypothetical protein